MAFSQCGIAFENVNGAGEFAPEKAYDADAPKSTDAGAQLLRDQGVGLNNVSDIIITGGETSSYNLAGAVGDGQSELRAKAKENSKKESERQSYMAQLLADRLAALQAEIEGLQTWNEQLSAAQEARANGASVQDVMEMDGVAEAIAAWEERTGKKFDPNDPNAGKLIDEIIADQQAQNDRDINNKREQRVALEDSSLPLDERLEQSEALADQQREIYAKQEKLAAVQAELNDTSVDQEVEAFMQELAMQSMLFSGDDLNTLMAPHIENLSDEAKEILLETEEVSAMIVSKQEEPEHSQQEIVRSDTPAPIQITNGV